MLRKALLIVSLALIAIGLGTSLGGVPGTLPMAIWGLVLLLAVLFERWRYQSATGGGAGGDWQGTDERFVDPESGQTLQVQYNPRTGERRYRPLDAANPGSVSPD
jgi:hypothetical protein